MAVNSPTIDVLDARHSLLSRMKDFAALGKLRLASLVVFSAVLGYFFAVESFSWVKLISLIAGGFLVTASSNAFNQIIEIETDAIMSRTQSRPLPQNRLKNYEALLFASFSGIIGVLILWFYCNPLSGILGLLALFVYVAIYTPLKKISPLAVFVGAFPGAVPPMLGYIAETGAFGLVPGLFFAIQFMWQFPHFWAIAWKVNDDYNKAGFYLLPFKSGKNRSSAFQILLYTIILIPVSISPFIFKIIDLNSAIIIAVCGLVFLYFAAKLYLTLSDKAATALMFASFFYLPIVQIVLLIGKI